MWFPANYETIRNISIANEKCKAVILLPIRYSTDFSRKILENKFSFDKKSKLVNPFKTINQIAKNLFQSRAIDLFLHDWKIDLKWLRLTWIIHFAYC